MKIPNPPNKPTRKSYEREFYLTGQQKLGDFFKQVTVAGVSVNDLVFHYYDHDDRCVAFSATIVEPNSEYNPRYTQWEKEHAEWEAKWGAAYKKRIREQKAAKKEKALNEQRKQLELDEARLKAQLDAINKKKAKL